MILSNLTTAADVGPDEAQRKDRPKAASDVRRRGNRSGAHVAEILLKRLQQFHSCRVWNPNAVSRRLTRWLPEI
jgi:hypothetical protein